MGTDQDYISATVLITNQDLCHTRCRRGEVWEVCVAPDNEHIIRVSEGQGTIGKRPRREVIWPPASRPHQLEPVA